MPNPMKHDPLILAIAILEDGKGLPFVNHAIEYDLRGGFISPGSGLINSEILNLLSIRSQKKDVVVLFDRESIMLPAIEKLAQCYQMHLPNHGIMFYMEVKNAISRFYDYSENDFSKLDHLQQLIWLSFKHGMHKEMMNNIRESGLTGATFFTGRGEFISEKKSFLGLKVAPQRETMLSVVSKERIKDVFDHLENRYQIEKTKGLKLLSMAVDAFSQAADPLKIEPSNADFSALFSIVNDDLKETYVDIMRELNMNGGTSISAFGTLSSEIIEQYFSIPMSPRKEIIFTIDKTNKINEAYRHLLDHPVMMAPHQGVYFTMPILGAKGLYQSN